MPIIVEARPTCSLARVGVPGRTRSGDQDASVTKDQSVRVSPRDLPASVGCACGELDSTNDVQIIFGASPTAK